MRTFLITISCAISTVLVSGCTITMSNLPVAADSPGATDGLVGVWAGPWREGAKHHGYLTAIVTRGTKNEYEAVVQAVKSTTSWINPDEQRPGFNLTFRVPLNVRRSASGEMRITGQSRQFHQWLGFFTIVLEGAASSDEIQLEFERAENAGKARLRRIDAVPLQTTEIVPFLVKARIDSPEMREQVRQAAQMSLDPKPAPTPSQL